ncbi:hypothetical protein prwr041_04170 [Prevotella herbatica]|uniref:Uncharacterized protein n=1 Tax=Prevotella herbatica TaxID=2801997 RepID=A0ABM7NVJ1_9BACT|nr:hypothetical protein [Prevotella herbatica]BCS84524.1 hypothetical protein prwr041_04170 [Prevotella herbatica]
MKEKENKKPNSVTMGKQYVNIEKMTDSEFISWLYLERDREESIRNNPGWNNWALVAALISVICYMYSILLIKKPHINVYKSIIFSSWIITILIFIKPWFDLFKVKRAIDLKRIRELKDEAPILDSCYIIFVSIIYSTIIKFKEPIVIDAVNYWAWMSLTCAFSISLIYVAINKHKIAPALGKIYLFPSTNKSFAFNLFIIGIALLANYSSKKEIPTFNSKEFVLGIVFATILVLFYILLKVNFSGGKKIHIDELIDKVVYKKYSRDNAYRNIQTIRLGYLPVDYLKSEVERLNEIYKECQKSISSIEEARDEISNQEKYSQKLIKNILKRIDDTIELCQVYGKSNKHLIKKLKEMSINKYTYTDTEFQHLVMSISDQMPDYGNLIKLCRKLNAEFKIYLNKFYCYKYKTRCDKEDCKDRFKTKSTKYNLTRKLVLFCHNKHS